MKRKNVKLYIGKKPCSVWRITFVNKFAQVPLSKPGVINSLILDKSYADKYYLTYFVFGPDYPTALRKLSFIHKDSWEVYKFERFETLDYDMIFEL